MIARVGDQVYGDEQDHFTCNTEQPGCTQVCYSRFSPISHLRFWSVMVIVTATPPITFLAYATNIISRHARKKEEAQYTKIRQQEDEKIARAQPKSSRYLKNLRKRNKKDSNKSEKHDSRHKKSHIDPVIHSRNSIISSNPKMAEEPLIPNGNHLMEPPNYFDDNMCNNGVPVYGSKNRYVAAILPKVDREAIMSKYRPLHHPDIARAYWWQVLTRTAIEIVFLWLQFHLFGFSVDFKYKCVGYPCPQVVECWVSRATEKTIFLWFMFIVGCFSALLGFAEFWSLGLQRFKVAFGCSRQTKIQKLHKRKPSLSQLEHMDLALDMDRFSICSLGNSGSSGSTISSV